MVHRYQVERSATVSPPAWQPVGDVTTDRTATLPDYCGETVFFRIRLLGPGENP